jgi:AcrR family transcriptional regulator
MTSTREHILFTALKLILKKGYGNITMNELVEASGLSKGAFYHYFKSKDQIYYETLEKYFFSYMASFDLTYNKALSFKSNLFQVFTMFIEFASEIKSMIGPENPMISYYHTLLESAIRADDIKKKVSNYYEFWIDRITGWIEFAQSNKEIDPNLDPETLSKHIAGLMEGVMIIYSFQTKEKSLEKYFNQIFYQFFELIKNKNLNENN